MTQPFVCEAKRVVFIRVPKTGSTSLWRVVNNHKTGPGWNLRAHPTHIRATSVGQQFVDKYKDFKWYGGMRHPHTWIPSLHRWLEQKNNDERLKWVDNYEISRGWPEFIKSIRWTPFDWLLHRHVKVQPVPVEHSQIWETIFDVKLPVLNVTDRTPKFEITPEIEHLIQSKFKRELAFYGNLQT